MIRLSPSLVVDDRHVREVFVRASGPGGQNVNKVATSVELRFDLASSGLPEAVKARAARLAGSRLTTDGVIVIQAHEHRTQLKNRQAARERLVALLKSAARLPRSRKPTKPSILAKEKRLTAKHIRSDVKRRRTGRADDE